MMIRKAMVKWILGGAVCALGMMACSLSGQAPDNTSTIRLQETELALQATQLSIQAGQLAATQTAMVLAMPVAQPTATVAPAAPPAAENDNEVQNSNGAYFEYPNWLAGSVTASLYEATPSSEDEPYFSIQPDHRIFDFNNYVLADHFLTPQILVFPLEEYRQINPGAAQQIARLEEYLDWQGVGASRPESMPFLPIFNAGQAFYTKLQFITTEHVSGIRYLTQYQQAVYPIQNGSMFYTFQGITADGQYYIAAIFPESHELLRQNDQFEYTSEFEENFLTYLTQTGDQLQAQPDESFQPALNALDAIFTSLRVQ